MKKLFKFNGLMLISFAGLFSLSASAVTLTDSTRSCKPLIDKTKKPPQVSIQGLPERVHKRMNRALEAMAEERYDDGIELLRNLLESARSDYVKANVNLNLAYAFAQKGDQDGSLPYFKEALRLGETTLPHERVQGLRVNVASLMFGIGEKQQALNMMLKWLDSSVVDDANAYYMIAALYADDGKLKKAMCPAYFAVKASDEPKRNYYQVLMALHWQTKDVKGTASMLRDMITLFPEEKSYWRQLSQIYFQLDKIDDALAIMEMFHLKGDFDKDSDYTWMSALFAYREIPYRAANILEEGLNKGLVEPKERILATIAQNYHQSSEIGKAIDAYGKLANITDTGEEFLKQAELLTDEERWNEAISAYDKAIQKGKLDDTGRAYFRKGTALVNMGRCDSGISVLEQAQKYKKYSQRAGQWVNFAKERKRNNKC